MTRGTIAETLAVPATLSLSSCSNPFFGGNEEFMITDIATRVDAATGDTIVTITFSDEEKEPLVLTIPQGVSGKDGVGISKIEPTLSEDGKSVLITIFFDDNALSPVSIEVPILEGRGIQDVTLGENEDGELTIAFVYTDGTSTDPIVIPSGKDGKDGVGIRVITASEPDENGVITVSIVLDDAVGTTLDFEVHNGKDGVSIVSSGVDQEASTGDYYVIVVEFSSGDTTRLSLPKPHPTGWFYGSVAPSSPEVASTLESAEPGDFYLNTVNGNVYQLGANGTWNYLFSMKSSGGSTEVTHHEVVFDANGGAYHSPTGTDFTLWTLPVADGQTADLSLIKKPTLDGHVFEGWFTDPDDVNSGQFTDLTPVTKDLTLKAKYRAI